MKKTFVALKPFNNKVFYNNEVFNEHSPTKSPYLIAARKLLADKNIIMNTIDTLPDNLTQKDIYMDVPHPWEMKLWIRIFKNSKKNILFIVEPPLVNPFSYMKILHLFFSKIYTQNDNIVDNIKYFKFFLPKTRTGLETKPKKFKDKKLLVLMNGNLAPFLPFRLLSLSTKELYTERIKAIKFFDTYHPSNFCLYGRGWNKPQRFSIRQRLLGYLKYKSYKGEFLAKDKYKILSEFKFCLCFENSVVTGYVSEKIFDCFKAKCVPVYIGTPNIDKLIPRSCYIDGRAFKNYSDLYNCLVNMKEDEYNRYIQNIGKLINNQRFQDQWFEEGFGRFLQKLFR